MSRNHFDLSGKVALVAGASRGIGESIARIFAEYGAHVIAASRRVERCAEVAEAIRSAGGRAEALACHIGKPESIEAVFAAIDERHGRIDILVNNAATNPHFGHVLDTPLAAFEKTMEVNLRGYFYASVLAARRMRTQGGGVIVNVASINGVRPIEKQAVYSISKAGILSMTQAFARECGPFNIRVNSLIPGLTRTQFASALHQDPEFMATMMPRVPLGRIAEADEMAAAALYLVSDAAAYATGGALVVDGGYLA